MDNKGQYCLPGKWDKLFQVYFRSEEIKYSNKPENTAGTCFN
ncbi:unnamed protein product [marine sediment metagenome]|uniref:Uncharacterized protein n=1 Tax=marine sediment metagenome TaxID=412755 RepID=X0W0F0_9ZZZZ